jgi:hypothetical protein
MRVAVKVLVAMSLLLLLPLTYVSIYLGDVLTSIVLLFAISTGAILLSYEN